MNKTLKLREEIQYQQLVLDDAIHRFGEAVLELYDNRGHLIHDSPEYKLALDLYRDWEEYLAAG